MGGSAGVIWVGLVLDYTGLPRCQTRKGTEMGQAKPAGPPTSHQQAETQRAEPCEVEASGITPAPTGHRGRAHRQGWRICNHNAELHNSKPENEAASTEAAGGVASKDW